MTMPEHSSCPQCGRDATHYRARGGRLICLDCYTAEEAKAAACTCETDGVCGVCREPDYEAIIRERAEARTPWWMSDPMYDGTPDRQSVPDDRPSGVGGR